MIARNDDSTSGVFNAKKLVVVEADQPRRYKSVIAGLEVELPEHSLRYTAMPNVDKKEGTWAASGINEENVGMTATETITTNPRVLGADPYIVHIPAKGDQKEIPGGIGEEDLVVLVLPYIHSAREGVLRLGSLLEKYGTYEPNGIAFNDSDEIWWLETIGGHHFIAKRVADDHYVTMPNQFGLDSFDLKDAFGEQKENLCSPDLKEFLKKNNLNLNLNGTFNPRLAFGSHDDSDHCYNTPRAWFIERYFNPRTIRWDGENAQFTPESDDIPWSLVPEKKITIEDMKYALSSHFQGTPYDPYAKYGDPTLRGAYRPIGVNRTSFLSLLQIRPNVKKEISAIEWVAFGSNVFNALVPLYSNVHKIPEYFSNTTLQVTTENFYWASRLLGVMADAHFGATALFIERYQNAVASRGHELVAKYDDLFLAKKDLSELEKANEEIASVVKEETQKALDKVLYEASLRMKNGYSRSDN
jgi:dipeptidase